MEEEIGKTAGANWDALPTCVVRTNSADSSRRIEVVLRIEKRFQNLIREDSSAALMTEGLLGWKVVNIQRGFAGPPVSAGGEIRVVLVKEATFTDFLDVLGKKADCQNEASNSPDAKSSTAVKQSPATRGPNRSVG